MAYLPLEMVRKDKKADQEISGFPKLIHQEGIHQVTLNIKSRSEVFWFLYLQSELPVLILGWGQHRLQELEWQSRVLTASSSLNGEFPIWTWSAAFQSQGENLDQAPYTFQGSKETWSFFYMKCYIQRHTVHSKTIQSYLLSIPLNLHSYNLQKWPWLSEDRLAREYQVEAKA